MSAGVTVRVETEDPEGWATATEETAQYGYLDSAIIGHTMGSVITRLGQPREILIAAEVAETVGEFVDGPEPLTAATTPDMKRITKLEEAFLDAAHRLVEAWKKHDTKAAKGGD